MAFASYPRVDLEGTDWQGGTDAMKELGDRDRKRRQLEMPTKERPLGPLHSSLDDQPFCTVYPFAVWASLRLESLMGSRFLGPISQGTPDPDLMSNLRHFQVGLANGSPLLNGLLRSGRFPRLPSKHIL